MKSPAAAPRSGRSPSWFSAPRRRLLWGRRRRLSCRSSRWHQTRHWWTSIRSTTSIARRTSSLTLPASASSGSFPSCRECVIGCLLVVIVSPPEYEKVSDVHVHELCDLLLHLLLFGLHWADNVPDRHVHHQVLVMMSQH